MLVQKYNYAALSRTNINGKRHYNTPTGAPVPSVTTILDKTKSKEKMEALANWRRRVGEQKAQAITTEAANRGTRMHTYLENYVLDGVLKEAGSNPYSWASHAMAQQIIDKVGEKGFTLDKRHFSSFSPIKQLGLSKISLSLFKDVSAELNVEVVSENPIEEEV